MADHFLVMNWNYDMTYPIGVFDTVADASAAVEKWAAESRNADIARPDIELWRGGGYTQSWRFTDGEYREIDIR
jgi:hypothetical protein